MTTKYARLLAAATLSIALAGGLSACGDDDSTAQNGTTMMGSSPADASTPATAAGVDAAFIRQMIPHHELAVEMAQAATKDAQHQEIKTLAAAIIAGQTKEITQLRTLAKDLGVSTNDATGQMAADSRTLGLSMDQMGMSMSSDSLSTSTPFDRAFIDEMVPHHTGAIAMANAQQQSGVDPRLKVITTAIIAAQTKEVAEMRAWRKDWYGDAAGSDSGHMNGDEHVDMPGMN